MSEKIWHLKRCDLFQRLTGEQLREVELRARARKFPRGAPIYLPADEADGVLLLTAGRAKICGVSADGKQSILAFIEPGELFGELAIFQGGRREEYAEAAETSTVLLIPADEMRRLVERHSDVAMGVTKLIGLRRRRIERRLKYLLFRSNRERLVHLLLELAEQYGRRTAEGVLLTIKLSHQDLANVIGSTRETVTVTLGELQAEGHLSVGRRKIVLRDLDRLAQSVNAAAPQLKAIL
jgi:CRP-like cAMP-binding protein